MQNNFGRLAAFNYKVKFQSKKWQFRILIAIGIILISGVGAYRSRHHGVSYEGKDVSYWFGEARPGVVTGTAPLTAFQAMGESAVPYLLTELKKGESSWDKFYLKKWQHLPKWAIKRLPMPSLPHSREERAVELLGIIGPKVKVAVPDLIHAYNEDYSRHYGLPKGTILDWSVQLTNPAVIMAWSGTPAIADDIFRQKICKALFAMAPDNKELVPLVLASLREPGRRHFEWLYNILLTKDNLVPAIRNSKEVLLAALNDANAEVRSMAAELLGKLLPGDKDVIPVLTKLLKDSDNATRISAIRPLLKNKIQLDAVVVALSSLAEDPSPNTARFALFSLVDLNAEKALPIIERAMENTNAVVCATACQNLRRLGPKGKEALPRLFEMAMQRKDLDHLIRLQMVNILWEVGQNVELVIPFRLEELRDPDNQVRWNAATFLAQHSEEAKAAVPILIEMLGKDESNRLRAKAAMTLERFGKEAKVAIPALKKALEDEYSNVQEAAKEALAKIEAHEAP
ncbi:MAG: repeat-containing protein [Pedosphaera sp.]|nr:repeat-containing protein [Pedosphaera sp.]